MIKSSLAPSFLHQIPKDTRVILTKALIFFIVWKLLYHLILFPIRVPDKQLTKLTAEGSALLYTNVMNEKMVTVQERKDNEGNSFIGVYVPNKKLVAIADSCNGLELIVLYTAFLFCFPLNLRIQISYALIGTVAIILLNIARCYGLTWMFMHNYPLADFFHKYIFKMTIYGLIFLTWVYYSKRYLNVQ